MNVVANVWLRTALPTGVTCSSLGGSRESQEKPTPLCTRGFSLSLQNVAETSDRDIFANVEAARSTAVFCRQLRQHNCTRSSEFTGGSQASFQVRETPAMR